jgi:hypothetical protein
VTGAAGSVQHSLERYLGGALKGAEPCRESLHHAHEDEELTVQGGSEDVGYEEDAVGRLREEAEMLQQQLDDVMDRLRGLGGEA